jgi:hypothetical protein
MSRQQVRSVVQAWFDPTVGSPWASADPGPPDSLDKCWPSFPKVLDFVTYARSDQPTHVHVVVAFRSQTETRESIGGAHAGWKKVVYSIVLQGFAESSWDDAEQAMADLDVVADALTARARADHTFGQDSTVIFRAAEDAIRLDFGDPLTNNAGVVEQWFQLGFDVEQFTSA